MFGRRRGALLLLIYILWLCAKLKSEILELGSFNNLAQHDKCLTFFFSKIDHPTVEIARNKTTLEYAFYHMYCIQYNI